MLTLKALVLSPLVGLLGGFTLMVILTWLVRPLRPTTVNRAFRVLQLGSAGFMASPTGRTTPRSRWGSSPWPWRPTRPPNGDRLEAGAGRAGVGDRRAARRPWPWGRRPAGGGS